MTSGTELAALSDDDLLNMLSHKVSGVTDDDSFDALPWPLRILWLLQDLDAELAIGGLLAYLTNSSRRYAAETVEALREIGIPQAGAILGRSIALIESNRSFVRNATVEHEILQPFAEMPNAQAISQIGDDLREALYGNTDFAGRLTSYLRAHLEEL
jgi:hypothetical protein